MRSSAIVIVGIFIFSCTATGQESKFAPGSSPHHCSKRDEIASEREGERLKDWTAVYHSFQLYRQCDDGELAEDYSDAVSILLSEHWPSVGLLARLARSDPQFGEFVLRHADSLMSPDQAKTIIVNAEKHCPAGARALCRRLDARVRDPF